MKKDKDLDHIRSTPNAGFTPRPKSLRKLGGGPVKITKPRNFERASKRLKETGRLFREDFNSGADIGAFIDWHNEMNKKRKEKEAGREILEISKLLAKLATEKTII